MSGGEGSGGPKRGGDAPDDEVPPRVAFVCVRNAGRSQMAAAFAERERRRRDLDVEIVTGGTDPAQAVHDGVVETMAEVGIDVSDRTPQGVTTDDLERCDVVATMGCSTLSLNAAVDVRDWALDDPSGAPPERVREIRDAVEERVVALFDELEAATGGGAAGSDPAPAERDGA
jgi:protein-tyrosine-phosphatase